MHCKKKAVKKKSPVTVRLNKRTLAQGCLLQIRGVSVFQLSQSEARVQVD